MVQKSANRFVLGTRRTGTRSPERRQYGLSIDTQGINGLSTGDGRQSHLIKFVQASSLLWERAVMPDWIRASSCWQFGKTIRRASFCTDSIVSSKYFGRAAQTGLTEPPTVRGTGGEEWAILHKVNDHLFTFLWIKFHAFKGSICRDIGYCQR